MKVRRVTDCARVGTLPLHFAISNKLTSEVRYLVEGGTHVNARDHKKRTALMLCSLENDVHWGVGVARMLLQAGAHAGLSDTNGRNALMFAVIFQRKLLVDLLLTAMDYNLNQRDSDGNTALHYAVSRGNSGIIVSILKMCKRLFVNSSTVENDKNGNIWNEDTYIGAITSTKKRDDKIFYNPMKSEQPWKRIVHEERETTRVHRSSSELNVHQFRRGPMRRFEIRSARRNRSTSLDTFSSSGSETSSFEPISHIRQITPVRRIRPSTTHGRRRPSVNGKNMPDVLAVNEGRSWRAYVPMFWHVLKEQNCPSYRPPANAIPQTFEEAIGLPAIEDSSEFGEMESEQTSRSMKNSFRRHSSFDRPSANTPLPQSARGRTNSEASIDTIAAGVASSALVSKPVSNFESGIMTNRTEARKTDPPQQGIPPERNEKKKDEDDIYSDSSSSTISLRSISAKPTKRSSKPARTALVRTRPGSALRHSSVPQNEKLSQVDTLPVPVNKLAKETETHHQKKPTTPTKTQEKSSLKEKKQETITEDSRAPDSGNKVTKPSQPKPTEESSKRSARRPETFLFRRVLSDILEENETPSPPARNTLKSLNPNNVKMPMRCASAHVRGKTANGRLLR